MEELIARCGDINKNTLFSQLVNNGQTHPFTKNIQQFQCFNIKIKKKSYNNLL